MKKGTIFVLVAVLVVALGVGIASAHKFKAKTTAEVIGAVKVFGGALEVQGAVSSPKTKCRKGRLVFVVHDLDPPGVSPNDVAIGVTTTSDEDGSFRTDIEGVSPDRVYALVAQKYLKKNDKHLHKCKVGVSETVPVEAD